MDLTGVPLPAFGPGALQLFVDDREGQDLFVGRHAYFHAGR
jgi:hypothetical protein